MYLSDNLHGDDTLTFITVDKAGDDFITLEQDDEAVSFSFKALKDLRILLEIIDKDVNNA